MFVSNTGTIYDFAAKLSEYRGEVFRSRLEARWAIYFDCLGIDYDYELDCFELPSGFYTPDFFFFDPYTQEEFWLEIKPKSPSDLEVDLMAELCLETDLNGVILYGEFPSPHDSYLEYGWYPGVGQFLFKNSWEDNGLYCCWKDLEFSYPTLARSFDEIKAALNNAVYFRF